MNGPGPVRLGLAGAGRWGRNFIRTIYRLPGVELVALASSNPVAQDLAGPGCRVFARWPDMLEQADMHGVIVATPPHVHVEIALAALRRGIGVLIEKPLCLDPAEAGTLLAEARTLDLPVLVDHIHLRHPAYVELKRLAHAMGPIRGLRGRAGAWGPFRTDTDVLWDWGPHDIAMFLDLGEAEPTSMRARVLEALQDAPGPHAQRLALTLEFSGGLAAETVVGNIEADKIRRLEVDVSGGRLVYDDQADDKLIFVAEGEGTAVLPHPPVQPLDVVVQAFAAALAAERRDIEDLELGAKVVRVLHALDADLRSRGR